MVLLPPVHLVRSSARFDFSAATSGSARLCLKVFVCCGAETGFFFSGVVSGQRLCNCFHSSFTMVVSLQRLSATHEACRSPASVAVRRMRFTHLTRHWSEEQ